MSELALALALVFLVAVAIIAYDHVVARWQRSLTQLVEVELAAWPVDFATRGTAPGALPVGYFANYWPKAYWMYGNDYWPLYGTGEAPATAGNTFVRAPYWGRF